MRISPFPLMILFLIPVLSYGQVKNSYVNIDVSLDPNKAFQIIDNPRTINDHKGLDFDVELGANEGKTYVYLFYGRFNRMDYQNYGFGVDQFLLITDNFEWKAGAGISVIMRKQLFGQQLEREGWGAALGYHFRTVGDLKINKHVSLTARLQYQRRPDINIGIVEGAVGIAFRFYRNL
jgi:hypothetical protein